jgi:hypothetical protein
MAFTGPKCSTNTCQVNNQVLVPNNTTNVLKSVENITDGRFVPYITGYVVNFNNSDVYNPLKAITVLLYRTTDQGLGI